MADVAVGKRPARESLSRGISNPLDWPLPLRCTLICVIAFIFTAWTDLIARYLLAHPDFAPYMSRPALLVLSHIEERVFLVGWAIIGVLGVLINRWGRGFLFIAYVLSFFFCLHVMAVAYSVGLFTTVYSGAMLMTGAIIGTLFLEVGPAIAALVTLIFGYVCVTIAEQLRFISYGPILIEAPYKDGHLARSWLMTFGGFDFGLLIAMFGLGLFIMQRWNVREKQLAEANRFLSRFLSPQVARMAKELGIASVVQKSRSQLTAIECDLRGFTAFSESVAPEEVIDLLERYYAAIGEAVSEFGGTIKDYSGDGVLILVGAPAPYPDHAKRAVSIAFKIREGVNQILSRWQSLGLELHVGVGLASGYVTVGAIGGAERLEYVAVGPAVNLAARLCERARSDLILVDQRTVSLLDNGDSPYRFQQLEPMELKGFSRPMKIFALVTSDQPEQTADALRSA
jgi:class 3 adenylate cyclase